MENGKLAADPKEQGPFPAETDSAAQVDLIGQLAAVVGERDQLAAEKAEFQDRWMRGRAEFDNFRRRAERERSDLFEFASMEAVRAMLPVLDDFERALKIESADKDYTKGMELIYQRMYDALTKLGLEPLTTLGQTFDPNVHHAVEMAPTSEVADQTILDEYQRGYNFKGKLLRPAMVKVAVRQ